MIEREPLGVVLVIAPWNYPYLTAVNSVVPGAGGRQRGDPEARRADAAGRRALPEAMDGGGLPEGPVPATWCSPMTRRARMLSLRLSSTTCNFTGSVAGGRAIERAAAGTFTSARPRTRRQGPGLCARRREPRPRDREPRRRRVLQFRPVLLRHRAHLRAREPLRPLRRRRRGADQDLRARRSAATRRRRSVRWRPPSASPTWCASRSPRRWRRARRRIIDTAAAFPPTRATATYLAPQVLTGRRPLHERDDGGELRPRRRHHEGVRRRGGDPPDERQRPTASPPRSGRRTSRPPSASASELETGTVFMNRCDYLDPGLAWTGVKDTGPRREPLATRLRGADPPEELPPAPAG